MPLHGYTTPRRPPTVMDHILAHSYGMAIALFGALGSLYVLASLVTELPLTSSVTELPRFPLAALCLTLVIGGINVTRGLLDDSDDIRRGFQIERGGLILSGTGWLAYSVIVLFGNSSAVLGWLWGVMVTVAIILRGAAGWLEERRLAQAVRGIQQHP